MRKPRFGTAFVIGLAGALVPFALLDARQANAASIREVVQTCNGFRGETIISPAMTGARAAHSLNSRGRMSGCNKSGGDGTFTMLWRIPASNCATLSGYRASGSATFEWANGRVSKATIEASVVRTSSSKVLITGRITGGNLYRDLLVEAEVRVTPVYRGSGAECSPSNPLRKLEFTNTRSLRIGGEGRPTGSLGSRPGRGNVGGNTPTLDPSATSDVDAPLPVTGPHPVWGALGLSVVALGLAMVVFAGPGGRTPRRGVRSRRRSSRPAAWLFVAQPSAGSEEAVASLLAR